MTTDMNVKWPSVIDTQELKRAVSFLMDSSSLMTANCLIATVHQVRPQKGKPNRAIICNNIVSKCVLHINKDLLEFLEEAVSCASGIKHKYIPLKIIHFSSTGFLSITDC
jgi:hypothetical protein